MERVTVEGESGELRGGDRVLARYEDPDVVVGYNITFTDARMDAEAARIIGGGQLITQTEGTDERVIGYAVPTIEEQAQRIPFQAELYVANFNASGGVDGFIKYTFPTASASRRTSITRTRSGARRSSRSAPGRTLPPASRACAGSSSTSCRRSCSEVTLRE